MSLLLVALLSVSAQTDAAQASKPVAANQAAASSASQANDDSEQPQTPEQKAAAAAYKDYMHSLIHTLRDSADARDRALATQMWFLDDALSDHEPTPAEQADRAARLRKAAEAASNDILVQWFWANADAEDSGCSANNPCLHRVEAVARLQPDNGSAWLPVFNAAWKANDIPAAESALAQMALATRFDEQFGTAIKAWMDVYRRYPVPKTVVAHNSPEAILDEDTRNFTGAMAFASVVAIPPYEPLVKACTHEKHPEASVLRFHDCAQAGRVMLTQSTSLLTSRIGRDLLRVSGQATATDIANARVEDWQFEHWHALVMGTAENDFSDVKATEADWMETGDEMQVMRRRLQRAGIPLMPPANWQPRGHDGQSISPLGEPPIPAKQP